VPRRLMTHPRCVCVCVCVCVMLQLFVFLKVLRVSSSSPYIHQVALVASELQEIYAKAPTDPTKVLVSDPPPPSLHEAPVLL
jgi:hypothetical protein